MAKGNAGVLLKGFSGKIGKLIVIKQYGNKTVITAYPRMPHRKPTRLKEIYESRFAAAIKYAQQILRDKELKSQYQVRLQPGQRVYNYAIAEYLNQLRQKDKSELQNHNEGLRKVDRKLIEG